MFVCACACASACTRAGVAVCVFGGMRGSAASCCVRGEDRFSCGPLPLEPGGRADASRRKLETRKASADERAFLTTCETAVCAVWLGVHGSCSGLLGSMSMKKCFRGLCTHSLPCCWGAALTRQQLYALGFGCSHHAVFAAADEQRSHHLSHERKR